MARGRSAAHGPISSAKATTTGTGLPAGEASTGQRAGALAEAMHDYLEYLERERALSLNTLRAYRSDLSAFIQWLPERQTEPDRQQLIKFLAYLKARGHRSTSVSRIMASLRGWFTWQKLTGRLLEDPSESLQNPQRERRLPQVLTPEE